MGIEPTWPLLSGHNGFEIRGGHQIRVHSPDSKLDVFFEMKTRQFGD